MGKIVRFRKTRQARRRATRRFWRFGAVAIVASFMAGAGLSSRVEPLPARAVALQASAIGKCVRQGADDCVVDGDTFHYGGATVRIADIDTPETHQAQCAKERQLGDRATLRLIQLLNERPFTLVRSGKRDLDRYGRQLRIVERDGQSLGAILVAEGLARRWTGKRRPWCG